MSEDRFMFDLETFSTLPTASIASIGACVFNSVEGIKETFYTNVSISDCKKHGLHISEDTVQWWKTQNKEVLRELMDNPRPLKESLESFFEFYKKSKCKLVYCWGASFDDPIIRNAASKFNMKEPWFYSNVRCARTLASEFGMKILRDESSHHNSLSDSIDQAKCMIELYNTLENL